MVNTQIPLQVVAVLGHRAPIAAVALTLLRSGLTTPEHLAAFLSEMYPAAESTGLLAAWNTGTEAFVEAYPTAARLFKPLKLVKDGLLTKAAPEPMH